jgi:adenosylcobyric acid synthase
MADGFLDESGRVLGTYVHGLFRDRNLRRAVLRQVAKSRGIRLRFKDNPREDEYDKLARLVRNNLDMELIYRISGLNREKPLVV